MIVCPEVKQKQPPDRKTIFDSNFETLSLPVAKILSPLARQAPTKSLCKFYRHLSLRQLFLKFLRCLTERECLNPHSGNFAELDPGLNLLQKASRWPPYLLC